jgi:hypothetical protein
MQNFDTTLYVMSRKNHIHLDAQAKDLHAVANTVPGSLGETLRGVARNIAQIAEDCVEIDESYLRR